MPRRAARLDRAAKSCSRVSGARQGLCQTAIKKACRRLGVQKYVPQLVSLSSVHGRRVVAVVSAHGRSPRTQDTFLNTTLVCRWPYKEMRTPWGKDSNGEETGLEVTRVAPSKASSLAALTAVSAKALGASAKRVKSESVARRAKPEAPARDSADVMSAVNALLSLQQ